MPKIVTNRVDPRYRASTGRRVSPRGNNDALAGRIPLLD